jgi:hypothetical protein
MHEVKWSPSEKSIARRVFEGALQRELDAITHEVKRMAQRITLRLTCGRWKII